VWSASECFVVERYPVDKESSGYTRQVAWVDKMEYRELKIEFYDRKDSLLKTLTFSSYRHYLNRYWRAEQMSMVNHQNGKSTQLEWSDYEFGVGLEDGDFSQNSLKRIR
jgi:outer membrane lipoprotein-sorting protein